MSVYEAGRLGEAEALVGFRVVQSTTGYCSQDPSVLHFGLGDGTLHDLRVVFRDGSVVERTGLAARAVVRIGEN